MLFCLGPARAFFVVLLALTELSKLNSCTLLLTLTMPKAAQKKVRSLATRPPARHHKAVKLAKRYGFVLDRVSKHLWFTGPSGEQVSCSNTPNSSSGYLILFERDLKRALTKGTPKRFAPGG